jgi:tetratricopeptide (TPR) repeat protein
MKFKLLPVIWTGMLFIGACGLLKPVAEIDEEKTAREAFSAGDYELALEEYEFLIETRRNNAQEVEGELFQCAGLAAYNLGLTDRALDHLERARHTDAVNDQTYAALARSYRQIDNLSREITHLENYLINYPEGGQAEELRIRYFETLVESRNWQQAYDLWPDLREEARADYDFLNHYFRVNLALGHENTVDVLAENLLAMNKDHTEALDRLARRYFHRAETRYQQEMDAYNRNRTHLQYAQLLAAFEELNRDFRTALNYFLKLYEQNPTREYASFLHNIYSRFENDERARYYLEKMGE